VLAGASLLGGVLTLEVGQAQGVAIAELLLAILYAVLSLRVRRQDRSARVVATASLERSRSGARRSGGCCSGAGGTRP
jgi:hypothetical protein